MHGLPALRALWVKATETKEQADDVVEGEISTLSYDLLGPKLCKKDRRHSDYRILFPAGNLAFIDGPDRAQVAHTWGMVTTLKDNPAHTMVDWAAALEEKNEAFDATLAQLTAAETAFRLAEATMTEKREALYRTLRKSVTGTCGTGWMGRRRRWTSCSPPLRRRALGAQGRPGCVTRVTLYTRRRAGGGTTHHVAYPPARLLGSSARR